MSVVPSSLDNPPLTVSEQYAGTQLLSLGLFSQSECIDVYEKRPNESHQIHNWGEQSVTHFVVAYSVDTSLLTSLGTQD